MDSTLNTKESIIGGAPDEKNFFKHVFKFDQDTQNEISNIFQYVILAIIPIIVLNKLVQRFIPEADEEKGNISILSEIIGQLVAIFVGIYVIHRIITFVPTLSKVDYTEVSTLTFILPFLIILLSFQTKLGEKVNILYERVLDLYYGKTDDDKKKGQQGQQGGQVKVSQPIATNQLVPSGGMIMPPPDIQMPHVQSPDFNSMYEQNPTPLENAATPQMNQGMFEPMAANEGMGGFSSW